VKSPKRKQTESLKSTKKLATSKINEMTQEVWTNILSEIKPRSASTEALLLAARPLQFDGKTLTLGVFYRFHKEKLETALHRRLLEDVAGEVLGNSIHIVCTLTEPPKKAETEGDTDRPKEKEESRPNSPDVVLTEGEDEDIIKVAKEIFGN
jgi:hypothetical protein